MITDRLLMPFFDRFDFERDERNDRINGHVKRWIDDKIIKRELLAEKRESDLAHIRAMASHKTRTMREDLARGYAVTVDEGAKRLRESAR